MTRFVPLLLLAGCFGPFVPVVRIDAKHADRLGDEVPIFADAQLVSVGVERMGAVTAYSCMNKLWEPPPSEADALAQLRYRATQLGGNALTAVLCEPEQPTSLRTNCWSSIACHGVAIRVQPVAFSCEQLKALLTRTTSTAA